MGFKAKDGRIVKNIFNIYPQSFSLEINKEFETETGISSKRFRTLVESDGKEATFSEISSLVKYYSNKTGRKVEMEELFGSLDDETIKK